MNIEDVRDVASIELELRAHGVPPELIDEYETAITAHCASLAVTYCEFDNEISGWNIAESAYLRAYILDDIDQRRH